MKRVGPESTRFLDVEAPGAGEVLVRLTRAGVVQPDGRGGIERLVGRVEAIGRGALGRDVRAGARVVVSPRIVCGTCDMCKAGLSDHCRSARMVTARDGDRWIRQAVAPATGVVALPQSLGEDEAVFAMDVARALHAARRIRIEGKTFVTILGDSAQALIAAQVMARHNASVRCLGEREACFSMCERWGVKHRHMDDVGRRHDQDVVVDCSGSARGLELGTRLVRPRGKLVLMAESQQDAGEGAVLDAIRELELDVIGVKSGHLSEAVAALASRMADVLPLISRRVRAGAGPAALETDEVAVIVEL